MALSNIVLWHGYETCHVTTLYLTAPLRRQNDAGDASGLQVYNREWACQFSVSTPPSLFCLSNSNVIANQSQTCDVLSQSDSGFLQK